MGKNVRTKAKGMQRSDIPYKDRLMVNQFANIAQHRDHSVLVANKVGMGKVMEEICDLYNALEVLKLDVCLKYESIRKKKMARWVERIRKAGGNNAR